MSKIISTDIVPHPPSNDVLPTGMVWKTHVPTKRPNPRRKRAPRNPQFAYLFV